MLLALLEIRLEPFFIRGKLFFLILERKKDKTFNNQKVFLDFKGAYLQGADISELSKIPLDRLRMEGAYYNHLTKLPFDDATAQRLGMIKVDI